ncbi:4Fe-4S binding protein [Mycoplasmatota bacterium]|nr:4Fe-4S binding protein [Mycoplasmatota bacterium]
MSVINFNQTNCQNCYACVRVCPVNAIKVIKNHAEIMETKCIACGKCLDVCPKNAKKVQSELEKVKCFLKNKEEVVVSIAPSFVSVFAENSTKISTALKKIGFSYVEETVVGAKLVTEEYNRYIQNMKDTSYITSCCPTINLLIQKYYPDQIPHLLPVVSPMVAHTRLLKAKYGNKVKAVFIGPCLSKKLEGIDENTIDAVLIFEELIELINENYIDFNELEESPFDDSMPSYRSYPLTGGVLQNIKQNKQQTLSVSGLTDCIQTLEAIKQGKHKNITFEMSACEHSCISGSGMPKDNVDIVERKLRVLRYSSLNDNKPSGEDKTIYSVNLQQSFPSLYTPLKIPSEEKIKEILKTLGKTEVDDELNCGTCGYKTCKDKAIAIYNGMAELNMCLPFMRYRAETLTNVIFDVTPNTVLMIKKDLTILEFNPAAETFFNMQRNDVIGLPVSVVLDDDLFSYVAKHNCNIIGKRMSVNNNKSVVIQNIVWIDSHEVMLCILHDITDQVKKQEWMKSLKINAIDMAQQVINKQMMVAQEIASLLGETTAETKVTLTHLKKLIQQEEDDKDELLR